MTLDQVRQKADEYDKANEARRAYSTTKFKELVDQYGVSYVAAASGLAESTVSQYTRCKVVPVTEYTLNKIISVLSN